MIRGRANAGVWGPGGSHGAYWAGEQQRSRRTYKAYIGSSTGINIALFSALGSIDPDKYWVLNGYEDLSNREMYGILNPWKKDGSINELNVALASLRMVMLRRNYAYDITPVLRKKLSENFTKEDFKALVDKRIEVIVAVKNMSIIGSGTEYVSNLNRTDMTYELFFEYIIASQSIPLLAKPVEINGCDYIDGGVLDKIPQLSYVFNKMDVFVCNPKPLKKPEKVRRNVDSWYKMLVGILTEFNLELQKGDMENVTNAVMHYLPEVDFNKGDFNNDKIVELFSKGWHSGGVS